MQQAAIVFEMMLALQVQVEKVHHPFLVEQQQPQPTPLLMFLLILLLLHQHDARLLLLLLLLRVVAPIVWMLLIGFDPPVPLLEPVVYHPVPAHLLGLARFAIMSAVLLLPGTYHHDNSLLDLLLVPPVRHPEPDHTDCHHHNSSRVDQPRAFHHLHQQHQRQHHQQDRPVNHRHQYQHGNNNR